MLFIDICYIFHYFSRKKINSYIVVVNYFLDFCSPKHSYMKKYYTLLLMMFCMFAADAQQNYKVGTGEEKKGILIEEFTGVRCPNCPDGHRVANEIYNGYRGQVYLVNVHTHAYVSTQKGNNLSTQAGEEIGNCFRPSAFPCAVINRHVFQNGAYTYVRDGWPTLTKKIKNDIAPVNLFLESSYDDNTRELTVHVEGYSTIDNSDKDMRLSVFLTQDYIHASQAGAENSRDYTHMHVLRDYITSTDGDVIESKAAGEYFSSDYTYTLPESVNDIPLKAGDINVLAIVTSEGMKEIANVKGVKPEYLNMNTEADAELQSPDIKVDLRYGFKFFEAKVRNKYSEKITNATFNVTINGEIQQITADCNIAPFTTGKVNIPCSYEFDEDDNVEYNIELTAVNGTPVTPASFGGSFERPHKTSENVKVVMATDRNSFENEFTLKDEDGNILKTFGPFEDNASKSYEEQLVLEEEKTYCIEVIDYAGNGLMRGKAGSLVTYAGSGKIINRFSPVKGFGARSFFTVDKSLAIDNITVEDNGTHKVFSINGTALDENNKSERIIIKDGKKYLNR